LIDQEDLGKDMDILTIRRGSITSRRSFLKSGAGMATLPLVEGKLMVKAEGSRAGTKRDNPIVEENNKIGSVDWQIQYTSFDQPISLAAYPLNREVRSSAIEGFASKCSVVSGEAIDFMVSMAPAGRFVLDIYRMGYYSGCGGRHMVRLGSFAASPQPMPMMTMERLRECNWKKSATFTIPKEWQSGIYLGKLTRDDDSRRAQSYVMFVVKEYRKADLLCQTSDLTANAYNKWPGNNSLYDDGTPAVWYTGPQVRVSFDRPYGKYCQVVDAPGTIGSGEFLLWEHPMVFWLEQQGYDVTYCSGTDLHTDPGILGTSKAFLSVGHDEYWSQKMFDEAMKAREEGLSFAFFSGNSIYHRILFYDSSITGQPCRAIARQDIAEGSGFGGREADLMGLKSGPNAYGDWVITKPEHWIYEKMNVKAGDRIPGLIGWEYNGTPTDIPGLEVVASSPLYPRDTESARNQQHDAVVFPCAKGNWVFNAGTIWWAEGLSCPPGHIPARVAGKGGTFGVHPWVQRITSNILDRMISDSPRKTS
jgi:hypothetical protein